MEGITLSFKLYYKPRVIKMAYFYKNKHIDEWNKNKPMPIYGEKDMTTHSSILAWRIPWTEEPGVLLYMGSHRVGHD